MSCQVFDLVLSGSESIGPFSLLRESGEQKLANDINSSRSASSSVSSITLSGNGLIGSTCRSEVLGLIAERITDLQIIFPLLSPTSFPQI